MTGVQTCALPIYPASVTGSGSSTMTVSTSGSTPTGTYTLTITATGGGLTHTTTVSLTVNPPPDFTLSATPASGTVIPGGSTAYTATVTALNGFNSAVTFSASGLPAGASAGFNPASVTGSGSSTMTVSTSGSTPTGTYTLTITATGGGLTHTTTVSLTVNPPPDFTVSASPPSQTVAQGVSTSYTVTVGALNGFNSVVTFSTSGLPDGASASFNPASVTGSGSSTLTVKTSHTATASTPPGTYTVTITGVSGSLTHNTTVQLIVVAGS